MWTRARFRLQAVTARALGALGTAATTRALVALLAAYAGAAGLWIAFASEESAERFVTSWPFWAVFGLAAADGVAAVARRLPAALPLGGLRAWRARPGEERILAAARLLLAAAWLLVALAALGSLAGRGRHTLRVAAGEEFRFEAGQVVASAPPRPLSVGPRPLRFRVTEVSPALDAAGTLTSLEVRLSIGQRTVSVTRWRPAWLGGSRFLRGTGYGYAPLFELAGRDGAVLDGAFIKVAVLPPGTVDQVRFEALPHRFLVQIPRDHVPGGGPEGVGSLPLRVDAFRGKLPLVGGVLGRDEELRFEGHALRIPQVRHAAELEIVDDPGILLALGAALAATAGAVLRLWRAGRRAGGGLAG